MAPGMKSYLYGMDRHNADDTAWYLMTVFFHSKERRFGKRAGQALHEICVKKGTAYEPYVLEVQPSKWMFLEQAELQWRNSLICPARVEITTTWRCRRKMSPLCHARIELEWQHDQVFAFTSRGLFSYSFLFSGGRYILCEARAMLAWLTLATKQPEHGSCWFQGWHMQSLIHGAVTVTAHVSYASSRIWKISLKRGTLARLPGPSCNIWSKRPSRRNCSSRHIKRPKSLTSSASATRKCPNISKLFWILNDSADSVQVHCARLTKDLKVNMQISWVSLQDSRATFSFLPTASS